MTRFILTDDQPITLTDRSTNDVAVTTKFGARSIVEAWYGALAQDDEIAAQEIDQVVAAIENDSDLSGSKYLGLSVELAD